nr:hypothetical protein [Corynebacterium lactis]
MTHNFSDVTLAEKIAKLADLLDVKSFTVADHNLIPRSIALEAASFLEVEVAPAATAMEICVAIAETFDEQAPTRTEDVAEYYASVLLTLVEDQLRAEEAKPVPVTTRAQAGSPNHLRIADPATAARNKLEAVQRISAITSSGPQSLGPGSKERKSVLTNLGSHFFPELDESLNKIDYFSELVQALGGVPEPSDFSTGYTITLRGLNKLLYLGSHYSDLHSTGEAAMSAADEADSYLATIATSLGLANNTSDPTQPMWCHKVFDGRTCVTEMFAAKYANRRQTEWFGWYVEFRSIPKLTKTFGGGPMKIGNTSFDYHGLRTWDIKAHTQIDSEVLLNDRESIVEAAITDGLGFLIVIGQSDYKGEGDFYRWHLQMRGKDPHVKRSERSRKLKVSVNVTSLEALFFQDETEFNKALGDGVLKEFPQGKQADGSPRKPKLKLNLAKALGSVYHVASLKIPQS